MLKEFGQRCLTGYGRLATVLVSLALVGCLTIGHYGISWDEDAAIEVAFVNAQIIRTGERYTGHLQYYGTLFNVTAEVIFQLQQRLMSLVQPNPPTLTGTRYPGNAIAIFKPRIQQKHWLTFLVALIGFGAVGGLVGLMVGADYTWIGPLALALFPRFWGHSFFNPRDIPFAALLTLGTLAGAYLIGYYSQCTASKSGKVRLGLNRLTGLTLAYGVLVGLISGTWLHGFYLVGAVAIAHGIVVSRQSPLLRVIRQFSLLYGGMVLSCAATVWLIYPSAWFNPGQWFTETLLFLYREPWTEPVLYAGQSLAADAMPWTYLPRWLLISTPIPLLLLAVLGGGIWSWQYPKLAPQQQAGFLLVLLQIGTIPIIMLLSQSPNFDGLRHYLFMLPGLAVLAAGALAWTVQRLHRPRIRWFTAVVLWVLISPILWDMIALHPYEYLYFNRFSGGLPGAYQVDETDYWGLSMREGMEWIAEQGEDPVTVVTSDPLIASAPFATPNMTLLFYDETLSGPSGPAVPPQAKNFVNVAIAPARLFPPFYYIAPPRWQFQARYPDCPVVHEVMRQGVPLTLVKQCVAAN